MESSGKSIILKGTFQSFLKNKYGTFIMFFKGNQIQDAIAVAGANSNLSGLKLHSKWTEIEDFLLTKIESNESDVSFSQKLKDYLFNRLKTEKEENKNKIIHIMRTNNKKKLSAVFLHLFDNIIQDKNISFDFHIEEKNDEDIQKDREEKRKKINEKQKLENEKKKKEKFNIPLDSKIIDTFLVLAPVNGIPITQIKAGDLISVKIDESMQNSDYYINLLNAEEDGNLKPIKASVTEIQKNDLGEYLIIVKINNYTYSIINETENVKVKPYDVYVKKLEKQDNKDQVKNLEEKTDKETKTKKIDYNFIIIIGVLAIVLITLIILFLIYGQ